MQQLGLSYEHVNLIQKRTFRVIHLKSPNTCGVVWHYHPEYEIVYVIKGRGKRYIGCNTSFYEGSDLAIIGSNVPHLNFHYGIDGEYEAYIIQLSSDFLDVVNQLSEFDDIYFFLKGILIGRLYGQDTQKEIALLIKDFNEVPKDEQLITLLAILSKLSHAKDFVTLEGKIQIPVHDNVTQERIKKIYEYVQANFQSEIHISHVSKLVNLSVPAFCRYFKKITQITFSEFVNEFRINKSIQLLLEGTTVTEACFDSGFKSLSNFNSTFKRQTGSSPLRFKKSKT
jgi:AraC-like DNA-binding protein